MYIKLTRSGGFAGITAPSLEVDTASLPKSDARRVEALVAGAGFFDLPETLQATRQQPDRFQYSLEVALDDGRKHSIICDEEAASEPLLQLLYAVQKLNRK